MAIRLTNQAAVAELVQRFPKEAYAPFGENYNEAGTQDRSFTGQDQAASNGTNVYDYLFRKYDPVAGRWLSPDPSGWAATSPAYPQSLNRYAYVQNDPMVAVDPDGLDCVYFNTNGSVSNIKPGDCTSQTDGGYYVNGQVINVSYTSGKADINYTDDDTGQYTMSNTSITYVFSATWGGADASVAAGVAPDGPPTQPGVPGAPNNQQLQQQINQLQQQVKQLQQQVQKPSYCHNLGLTIAGILAVGAGAEGFALYTGEATPPAIVGHVTAGAAIVADGTLGVWYAVACQ